MLITSTEVNSIPDFFRQDSALIGKKKRGWQDVEYVLGFFEKKVGEARKAYECYVEEGIPLGRRPELVGGGLIRTLVVGMKSKNEVDRLGTYKEGSTNIR